MARKSRKASTATNALTRPVATGELYLDEDAEAFYAVALDAAEEADDQRMYDHLRECRATTVELACRRSELTTVSVSPKKRYAVKAKGEAGQWFVHAPYVSLYGCFGTRYTDEQRKQIAKGWHVTHRGTGCKVQAFATLADARKALRALHGVEIAGMDDRAGIEQAKRALVVVGLMADDRAVTRKAA